MHRRLFIFHHFPPALSRVHQGASIVPPSPLPLPPTSLSPFISFVLQSELSLVSSLAQFSQSTWKTWNTTGKAPHWAFKCQLLARAPCQPPQFSTRARTLIASREKSVQELSWDYVLFSAPWPLGGSEVRIITLWHVKVGKLQRQSVKTLQSVLECPPAHPLTPRHPSPVFTHVTHDCLWLHSKRLDWHHACAKWGFLCLCSVLVCIRDVLCTAASEMDEWEDKGVWLLFFFSCVG